LSVKNKHLRETMKELEQFREYAVGRELRMVDLKKRIKELLAELGRPSEYDLAEIEGIERGESHD